MTDTNLHAGVNFACVATASNNATVCEVADDSLNYDTWILGSTAGKMDVQVSLDGASYLSTAMALLDMCSIDPSTMVLETAANRVFCLRGKFKKIKLLQQTDNVSGAALIGYRTM